MSAPRKGVATWLAAGLGSGFAPIAPGTFGSLVGVVVGLPLLAAPLHALWLVVAAIVATLVGLWAIPRASNGEDHGWIVIDEIAGQLLAMSVLPPLQMGLDWRSAGGVLLDFLLFRLFDITKPGPIGWADRQHGAGGIMGDDLLAGLAAAIVLGVLRLAIG